MSAEENKAVIRRLIEEVYNEDNQNIVDKLVAPDVFNHSAAPEYQRGIEKTLGARPVTHTLGQRKPSFCMMRHRER